jgi:fructokinase
MEPLFGAVEAGGTKFLCAVGTASGTWIDEARIPTTTPDETLGTVLAFFDRVRDQHGELRALGIASFGPVELDRQSPGWGHILPTPKAGWSNADLVGPLRDRYGWPVAINTDVSAAALAEHQLGAARGCRSSGYVTVGTGIGGGFVLDGKILRGVMHPEIGHLRVQRAPGDSLFPGTCSFHGDCLEGLASGPAIAARWGFTSEQLAMESAAVETIAFYIGQLMAAIALTLSCERVVVGGGVLQQPALLDRVRFHTGTLLNGYLPQARFGRDIHQYVVAPGLGHRSGLIGARLLAQQVA